ncbi:MAG: alpha-ketoglutarate-dependent dioxygenase AlkB [Pseudomonadota bacterium]
MNQPKGTETSTSFNRTRNLCPRDGEIFLLEDFYGGEESNRLFGLLLEELAWQAEDIIIAGKRVSVPRLMCWYGEPEAEYTYSGVKHAPLPWNATLRSIKEKSEHLTKRKFNSVLVNLYRDGSDSMGWHADKEKELGRDPFIASLSLGKERLFRIRHNKTKETLDIPLKSGSLLIMGGALQHHWRHCVPKTRQAKGPRINLTFRYIRPRKPNVD